MGNSENGEDVIVAENFLVHPDAAIQKKLRDFYELLKDQYGIGGRGEREIDRK
jgi:hypothetical protein